MSEGEDYETFHILWENMMRELRPSWYACVELLALYEGARTWERAHTEISQYNIANSNTPLTSAEQKVGPATKAWQFAKIKARQLLDAARQATKSSAESKVEEVEAAMNTITIGSTVRRSKI